MKPYRATDEGLVGAEEVRGEASKPTPAEERSLARKHSYERNRVVGMFVVAAVLYKLARLAPVLFEARADVAQVVLAVLCVSLFAWAFWSWASPRIVVPSVVGIDDRREAALELTLGRTFDVHVVLHPRNTLAVDPLLVRFVARQVGRPHAVLHSAETVLARGQSIAAGEAVRHSAQSALSIDAPPTRKGEVAWSVEISVGDPPAFTRALPVRVLPPRSSRAAARRKRKTARS